MHTTESRPSSRSLKIRMPGTAPGIAKFKSARSAPLPLAAAHQLDEADLLVRILTEGAAELGRDGERTGLLEQARRQLPQPPAHRVAILVDHDDVGVLVDGENRDGTVMLDDFASGGVTECGPAGET